jgi:glyoxylase-like metal-dependent hydrolase (beta-lactamase superfamily II)
VSFQALDLGGPRLYWLDGGGFRLDGGSLFGPVPRPRWSAQYPPADDNSVPLTAHVVLVESASGWGLLDTGFGHHLTDRQKRAYTLERESQLEHGLAELGISSSAIDWVVLSHLHLDHAGGVLGRSSDDHFAPVFANASVWVQALEAREARDQTNRAHGMYTGSSFDSLEALGLVHEVDGESEIAAGVRVFLTGGHSRGHQATVVTGARGAALLHLGDLLVTHAHLPPAWVSALDDFPLDSIRAKREWLAQAIDRDWWVAFSHDVTASAARLDSEGKIREVWPPRSLSPEP